VVVTVSVIFDSEQDIPFLHKDEIGSQIHLHNGAIRSNPFEDYFDDKGRINILVRQLVSEFGGKPCYGLKIKYGNRRWLQCHFILEFGKDLIFAIFIHKSVQPFSVNKVHDIERLLKLMNLQGVIIIAKTFGNQAIREIKRINRLNVTNTIHIEQMGSLIKRFHFNKIGSQC